MKVHLVVCYTRRELYSEYNLFCIKYHKRLWWCFMVGVVLIIPKPGLTVFQIQILAYGDCIGIFGITGYTGFSVITVRRMIHDTCCVKKVEYTDWLKIYITVIFSHYSKQRKCMIKKCFDLCWSKTICKFYICYYIF